MRYFHNRLAGFVGATRRVAPTLVILLASTAAAQTPGYKNIGRTPTEDEIRAWDTVITLKGEKLPPGKGTAKEGAAVYSQHCASCHGDNLEGRVAPRLAG